MAVKKVYCVTPGFNAGSYYRCDMWVEEIKRRCPDRFEFKIDRQFPDSYPQCDVLYVSAYYSYVMFLNDWLAGFKARNPRAKVILETDDLFTELSACNQPYAMLPPSIPAMKDSRFWNHVDVFVASTPEIAKYYAKHFIDIRVQKMPEITVIENSICADDWMLFDHSERIGYFTNFPGNQPIRIGWQGSYLHRADFQLLDPLLNSIKNDPKYIFVFFGAENILKNNKILDGFDNIEVYGQVPYKYFSRSYQRLNIDIALAPLVDDVYNNGKSGIKVLEGVLAGAVPLASSVAPYKRLLEEKFPMLLLNNNEWSINLIRERLDDLYLHHKHYDTNYYFGLLAMVYSENNMSMRVNDWVNLLEYNG